MNAGFSWVHVIRMTAVPPVGH